MRPVLIVAIASLLLAGLAGCMDAFPPSEDAVPRPDGWEAPPLPEVGADLPPPYKASGDPEGRWHDDRDPCPTQLKLTSARHFWQGQQASDANPQGRNDTEDGSGTGGNPLMAAWNSHQRIPFEVGYEDWLRVTYGSVYENSSELSRLNRFYLLHDRHYQGNISKSGFGPGIEVVEGEYDWAPPFELQETWTTPHGQVVGWVVFEVKIRFTELPPPGFAGHGVYAHVEDANLSWECHRNDLGYIPVQQS